MKNIKLLALVALSMTGAVQASESQDSKTEENISISFNKEKLRYDYFKCINDSIQEADNYGPGNKAPESCYHIMPILENLFDKNQFLTVKEMKTIEEIENILRTRFQLKKEREELYNKAQKLNNELQQ